MMKLIMSLLLAVSVFGCSKNNTGKNDNFQHDTNPTNPTHSSPNDVR